MTIFNGSPLWMPLEMTQEGLSFQKLKGTRKFNDAIKITFVIFQNFVKEVKKCNQCSFVETAFLT